MDAPAASTAPAKRPLTRRDHLVMAGLALFALLLHVVTAALAMREAGMALSSLGVFYDGHLYLEIARSFPFPYSPAGPGYLGHAPGYPALLFLGRLLTPDALLNWGGLALWASWIPAALCVPAFYLVARERCHRPLWPALLFLLANPRWLLVAAGPRPESLAMLLVILCLLAYLRGRVVWSCFLLTLAMLTRFPAMGIGAALAAGILLVRRDRSLRSLAALSMPIAAFALLNLYLWQLIPGFGGVWEAHQVHWRTELVWPFQTLWAAGRSGSWGDKGHLEVSTYLSIAVYGLAIAAAIRLRHRDSVVLAVWVAVLLLAHASLSGLVGAWDFTRLVILAWPAALLALWCFAERYVPLRPLAAASALLALVLGSYGLVQGQRTLAVVRWQATVQPFIATKIERLQSDVPHWLRFRRLADVRKEQEQR